MNEYQPKHLDVCSGIGGFAIAFQDAGFETVGFSEIAEYPSAVLRERWPTIENYGSVDGLDTNGILKAHGQIDCLTAGVPCQPASLAGKRRGEDDIRWLWPAVLRVVGEILPRYAVFENPPGLLSLRDGRTFESILCNLVSLGYDLWWDVIPACAISADHERERLFIVANAHGPRPQSARISGETENSARLSTPASLHWGKPSSYFLRNIHGIPYRAHRIIALGNSVVPQAASVIAKAIYKQICNNLTFLPTNP